jgi:hypothetical protein
MIGRIMGRLRFPAINESVEPAVRFKVVLEPAPLKPASAIQTIAGFTAQIGPIPARDGPQRSNLIRQTPFAAGGEVGRDPTDANCAAHLH